MSESNRNTLLQAGDNTAEAPLTATQEEALTANLRTLPTPLATEEFNTRLTTALQAGHDFRPLPAQIATRLRWMLAPAALGFALTLAFVQMRAGTEQEPTTAQSVAAQNVPPPLPPLPLEEIPAPRSAERPVSAKAQWTSNWAKHTNAPRLDLSGATAGGIPTRAYHTLPTKTAEHSSGRLQKGAR